MNYLDITIFLIVLFIYLHVYYHLKSSNDMEIYTLDEPIKNKLEEICNIKQPLKFNYNDKGLNTCNIHYFETYNTKGDIKIRDTMDKNQDNQLFLPFELKEGAHVLKEDKKSRFITEQNGDFINNIECKKDFINMDKFLKPPMTLKTYHDFYAGSIGSNTPLRYSIDYRNFFYVSSGKITLKLIPPIDSTYLDEQKNYDVMEFSSPINPWNVSDEHKTNFNNVNHMDIELTQGDIIYIPAYWWYSIKYEELSSVCVFKYRTFMNSIAIFPELILSFFQGQNIKHKTTPSIDTIMVHNEDKEDNAND